MKIQHEKQLHFLSFESKMNFWLGVMVALTTP